MILCESEVSAYILLKKYKQENLYNFIFAYQTKKQFRVKNQRFFFGGKKYEELVSSTRSFSGKSHTMYALKYIQWTLKLKRGEQCSFWKPIRNSWMMMTVGKRPQKKSWTAANGKSSFRTMIFQNAFVYCKN